jgi:hypothetical protein
VVCRSRWQAGRLAPSQAKPSQAKPSQACAKNARLAPAVQARLDRFMIVGPGAGPIVQ